MNVFSQATRLGRLTTSLGKDRLVLLRFDGTDYLNDLFEFHVEALSDTAEIDFDKLIGTHATIEIESSDGAIPFDGIVTEARWRGPGENGWRYDLVLRPWLWLLGRRRNQRIFHNMTAPDIIAKVMGEYAHLGNPGFKQTLTNTYPELEYTVQYRESDLSFVRRLMERFGISFHVTHAMQSHTVVMTDHVSSHENIGELPYYPVREMHRTEDQHFWSWSPARRFTTGSMRLTDFNFKTPSATMETEFEGDAAYAEGKIESYDYPGEYLDQDEGKTVATLRTEQERGNDVRFHAEGDCVSLKAGSVVTQKGGEPCPGGGKDYLCLAARYTCIGQGYGSGGVGGDQKAYEAKYVLMPITTPMVPPRVTPLPLVQGLQTAMVVGEGEIDCDEYGRILVRFHWDLPGRKDHDEISMRCRVGQNWASKGWGGVVIPRIGMEVVVEFLEGDPDKPLVTGCVYNGETDLPYPLPDNKTKSVFRTDTHEGEGFNELSFEDQSGEEKIYLHAQKDHELHIENNRAKRVDKNQSESVGFNKSIEIGNNHDEIIGGNMTLMVGPNKLQAAVTGAFKAFTGKIGGLATGLGLPDALNMGEGNLFVGVAKNKAETVMVSSTEVVGAAKAVTVGGGMQLTVGGVKNESVAVGSWEEVGQTKVIVVGHKYEVVCGKSKLIMDRDGNITLSGVKIHVEGTNSIKAKASKIDMN